MSVYKNHLPNVFPHCLILPIKDVERLVKLLINSRRKDVPQGSSFAVTVDNWDGTWNLWLSDVSLKFLREHTNLNDDPVDTKKYWGTLI